jgi:hypothetical protein
MRLDKPASPERYREQWAVVIGIDYKNGPLPTLRNAEHDAQSVRDIL